LLSTFPSSLTCGLGCSPLLIAPPLADSSLARLRFAAPCQSRCRATWPPLKYPHPSRAAFEPSARSQESVRFTQNGGIFVLDLLSSNALGTGFDNALFTISLNGGVIDSQSFTDLASAEAFFSNHLINVPLLAGPNSVLIGFSETMSSIPEGFSFDYAVASVSNVPDRCSPPRRWTKLSKSGPPSAFRKNIRPRRRFSDPRLA
jgi:hypothetical protein